MSIRDNIRRVREGIDSACREVGRSFDEVTLMAVTKTVEAARINEALSCGITHIGENRVQEFLGKREMLHPAGDQGIYGNRGGLVQELQAMQGGQEGREVQALQGKQIPQGMQDAQAGRTAQGMQTGQAVQAHLIGHLQTNKAAHIVGQVDMIQSIDSVRVAAAVAKCAAKLGIIVPVLVEVNIGGETAKEGVQPQELQGLLEEIAQIGNIQVRGLMTIPPILTGEKEKRAIFAKMYRLYMDMAEKKLYNSGEHILSMGMSGDYREAIMEGSTLVRVGTGIFGIR